MEHKSKRRIFTSIALALMGAMVFGSFAACKAPPADNTGGGTTALGTAAPGVSTTADPLANYDSANIQKQDYGGVTINFMVDEIDGADWTEWVERDLTAENETGDTINDAVYKRNAIIQQDFNVKFAENPVKGSNADNFGPALQKMVASGAQDNDILINYVFYNWSYAEKGLFYNMYNMPNMDLSKPYYSQNSINGYSIAHYLPYVQSSMLIKPNDAVTAMVFNKQLAQDYGMGDMYQLVTSGQWTLDKLTELASQVSVDLNGDGKMYILDDKFGLITQADTLPSFMHGSDCSIATKDAGTDTPVLSFDTPKTYDALDKTYNLMFNGQWSVELHLYYGKFPIYDQQVTMFEQNHALFSWIRMIMVERLRGMDTDFGILPIPKYDTNQTTYYDEMNPYTSNAIGVPMSNQNLERTGTIIEAMSALGQDILQPAYYDINLNGKLVRDDQSKAMLDIILANVFYDPGQIYDIGGFEDTMVNALCNGTSKNHDFATMYAKSATKMQTDLDKVINTFSGLAG